MRKPVEQIITPIKLRYLHTAGHGQRHFLAGLAEGRIFGQRCPACRKVYVPPRGVCPTCAVATREDVELSDKGTVTTFCVVNLPFYGQAVEVPYVCASVLLDGADISFFHMIAELPVGEVHMGLRVKALWLDQASRVASFQSIRYFRPSGEPDAAYESYKEHL